MPANAEDTPDAAPEVFLQVLDTLTEETRRRRARSLRGRVRARRISLAIAVLAVLALGTFSILVMSRVLHLHVLHASVSAAPAAPSPTRPPQKTDPLRTRTGDVASTPVAVAPRAVDVPKAKSVAPATASASLRIDAVRGPSWITARRGTSAGPVLYEGTVAQGGTLRLRAPRVWVTFGALANLDLRLNGEPVSLVHTGTVEAVFTAKGVQAS